MTTAIIGMGAFLVICLCNETLRVIPQTLARWGANALLAILRTAGRAIAGSFRLIGRTARQYYHMMERHMPAALAGLLAGLATLLTVAVVVVIIVALGWVAYHYCRGLFGI